MGHCLDKIDSDDLQTLATYDTKPEIEIKLTKRGAILAAAKSGDRMAIELLWSQYRLKVMSWAEIQHINSMEIKK